MIISKNSTESYLFKVNNLYVGGTSFSRIINFSKFELSNGFNSDTFVLHKWEEHSDAKFYNKYILPILTKFRENGFEATVIKRVHTVTFEEEVARFPKES
jgi:hypothetical protein